MLNCYRYSKTFANKTFDINFKSLTVRVLIFLYKYQIRNAVTLVGLYGFQRIKPQNSDGVDWGKLNPDILVYRRKVYHSVFRMSAMTA